MRGPAGVGELRGRREGARWPRPPGPPPRAPRLAKRDLLSSPAPFPVGSLRGSYHASRRDHGARHFAFSRVTSASTSGRVDGPILRLTVPSAHITTQPVLRSR